MTRREINDLGRCHDLYIDKKIKKIITSCKDESGLGLMHVLGEGITTNNTSVHSTQHVQKKNDCITYPGPCDLDDGPKSPKPQIKPVSAKPGSIEKSKRHADGSSKFLRRRVFPIK